MYQTSLSQKTIWLSDNRSNLMGSHRAHNLNQYFLACWELTLPAQQKWGISGKPGGMQARKKEEKKGNKRQKKNKPAKSIRERKNYSEIKHQGISKRVWGLEWTWWGGGVEMGRWRVRGGIKGGGGQGVTKENARGAEGDGYRERERGGRGASFY